MNEKKERTPLQHVCWVFRMDAKRILKHQKEWEKLTNRHARPWPKEGSHDKEIIEDMKKVIEKNYEGTSGEKRKATLNLFRLFKPHEGEVDPTKRRNLCALLSSTDTSSAAAPEEAEKTPPPELEADKPPPYQGIYPVLAGTPTAAGYQDLPQRPTGAQTVAAGPSAPPAQGQGEDSAWTTGKIAVKLKKADIDNVREWFNLSDRDSSDDDDSFITESSEGSLVTRLRQTVIDAGGEVGPRTGQAMIVAKGKAVPRKRPELTAREIVAREDGRYFSEKFCDDLSDWCTVTEPPFPWPREGSFSPSRLRTAADMIFGGEGAEFWDYDYMRTCFTVWEKHVKDQMERNRDCILGVKQCPRKYDPRGNGGQYPLIFKQGNGALPVYSPWQQTDKETLRRKLPPLHEGADKWISEFETQTAGLMLATGDVKSLLGALLGGTETEDVFIRAQLPQVTMVITNFDGVPFNNCRMAVWAALREKFPPHPDIGALMNESIGATETPGAFLDKMKRKWQMETGSPHTDQHGRAALFYNILKQALPPVVQEDLSRVVGIETKPWVEIEQHIVHYIKQQREKERKEEESRKRLEVKVLQQKLEKKVMPVLTSATGTCQMGGVQGAQGQCMGAVPQHQTGWQQQPPQQQGTGAGGGRGGPRECYYCHKLGHIARECRKRMKDQGQGQGGMGAPQQQYMMQPPQYPVQQGQGGFQQGTGPTQQPQQVYVATGTWGPAQGGGGNGPATPAQ